MYEASMKLFYQTIFKKQHSFNFTREAVLKVKLLQKLLHEKLKLCQMEPSLQSQRVQFRIR